MQQAEVTDVQREADGSVSLHTNAAVSSEADVQISVDWAHRFDLMQQHTGTSTAPSLMAPKPLQAAVLP